MRSQKDPYFSSMCDRVGRGKINEEDDNYLRSRIQPTESEKYNENCKNGKLSIIVTTNKKRHLVNSQKLAELIPFEKEFTCNSIDRVKNIPGYQTVPKKFKDNPGKTGNLLSELTLKIGAPVVITTNHVKQKFREDGIVNGARGFIQSIQVSKDDPNKVDIIWVVFNRETIGRLYRFEHSHLKKRFNPGHELATPILPQRKNFTVKFGNVEYQRTNFPLSLAYAITAHKCQGETLEEVIIDFGPDLVHKIKNYICPGSFYVALTRVKMGSKVFLRSFDQSYIQVNKSIEEKTNAMRKFRKYDFKKIYLDEEVFDLKDQEIKAGYLNINGLLDGGHAEFLNADLNLRNLDILVLAETKLDDSCSSVQITKLLTNWKMLGRHDSKDETRHMGMLLLTAKHSSIVDKIESVTHQTLKRGNTLQIQGLIVRFTVQENYGFVYCRSTPNQSEIQTLCKHFEECQILMGDFNLSHRLTEDQNKVKTVCQGKKINTLNEITRSMSNNQLDYIFMDEYLIGQYFVTIYNNFISDHKSIISRIGFNGNKMKQNIKEWLTFDQDSHMKQKRSTKHKEQREEGGHYTKNQGGNQTVDQAKIRSTFSRRFENPDMATCWLNSCLQLILTAIDYDELTAQLTLTSELGQELLKLHFKSGKEPLNPTVIKDIIVTAEDTRIATRLSELSYEVINQSLHDEQAARINNLRLDLRNGQQCVRDFFICLNENLVCWPDVFSTFSFNLTHSSECSICKHKNQYETNQLYVEMAVPPNKSVFKGYVEDFFHERSEFGSYCDEGCKALSVKNKWSSITTAEENKFFIVILTRGIETLDGYQLVRNEINSTESVQIR